jgi:plastocyanin
MRSGCRSVIGGCLAGAKPATNPDSSMKKGDTYSFTFNEAGTFDYTCTFHPGMNGKVIVN